MGGADLSWTCSFCSVNGNGTRGVVAGPSVFVCKACVAECRKALTRARAGRGPRLPWVVEHGGGRCSFCYQEPGLERPTVKRADAHICSMCVETCEDIFTDQARP